MKPTFENLVFISDMSANKIYAKEIFYDKKGEKKFSFSIIAGKGKGSIPDEFNIDPNFYEGFNIMITDKNDVSCTTDIVGGDLDELTCYIKKENIDKVLEQLYNLSEGNVLNLKEEDIISSFNTLINYYESKKDIGHANILKSMLESYQKRK